MLNVYKIQFSNDNTCQIGHFCEEGACFVCESFWKGPDFKTTNPVTANTKAKLLAQECCNPVTYLVCKKTRHGWRVVSQF